MSDILNNSQALVGSLNYSLKPNAFNSRSYRTNIPQSNKQTNSPGDQIIILIPQRSKCYMNQTSSYLQFTVNNTSANTIYVDNSAYSFINRLDVYHSGNLLETITNYNVLCSLYTDFYLNREDALGQSTNMGFSSEILQGTLTGATYAQNATVPLTSLARQGVSISAGASRNFCVPLSLSGVLGSLCSKYLPIGALKDDLRVEITLEQQDIAVYSSASSTWTISNVNWIMDVVELSDMGQQAVDSVIGDQPIVIATSSFRNYPASIATSSSGTGTILVPARFSSLKTLWWSTRNYATTQAAYSISSRVCPYTQYNFRVGSLIVPQKPVICNNTNGNSESFSEIEKAKHSLGSLIANGQISAVQYNVAHGTNTGASSYLNAYAIGQELESFTDSNSTDKLVNGTNTLAVNIFAEYSLNGTTSTAFTLDFFAQYDMLLVIDQQTGIMTMRL